jgi:hypothetical protein
MKLLDHFIVYKHTCPNGKIYIGITSQTPDRRWMNGLGYREQPLFWRAIQKYGWENIQHEILLEGLSKEAACQYEVDMIAYYNSADPSYGYNADKGGTVNKLTDVQKAKLSKKRLNGIKLYLYKDNTYLGCFNSTIELAENIQKVNYQGLRYQIKGKDFAQYKGYFIVRAKRKPTSKQFAQFVNQYESAKKPWLGKARSAETVVKMGCWQKGHIPHNKGSIGEFKTIIHQYDIDMNLLNTFKGYAEAADKTGISKSCIVNNANGHIKTTHGFIFKKEVN